MTYFDMKSIEKDEKKLGYGIIYYYCGLCATCDKKNKETCRKEEKEFKFKKNYSNKICSNGKFCINWELDNTIIKNLKNNNNSNDSLKKKIY